MKRTALAVLVALALQSARADEPMTKVVFRQESADVAPGSYGALPKTIYRWTATKGRIEQAFDKEHNVQPLFIADGKDGWFIDETSKNGKHMIDPSTDHNFYAPIVPRPDNQAIATNDQIARDLSAALRGFEIGHELDFMRGQNVSPQAVTDKGTKYLLYACTLQNYNLRLYLSADTAQPAKSEVWLDGKALLRIVYVEYKSLPPDPALFAPPAGISITEAVAR